MIELIEAIVAKVGATPALTAELPGGFHLDHPGPQTLQEKGAFGVIADVSAIPEYNTSKNYVEPVRIQISLFARKLGDIKTTIKAYRDAFTWQPLNLSTGRLMSAPLVFQGKVDDQADNDDAFHSKHYVLEWEFTQIQAHA
jgi:hypothetical protein